METAAGWRISASQKELLDKLFQDIPKEAHRVLDLGSWRTSMQYLTVRYPEITIQGVVYPGDERKIGPIKECVANRNYSILQIDLKSFDPGECYDVILAHLFLGEAEKFAANTFEDIVIKLLSIPARYLVLVNLRRDKIDYHFLLNKISEAGEVIRIAQAVSADGSESLGMTIKFNRTL